MYSIVCPVYMCNEESFLKTWHRLLGLMSGNVMLQIWSITVISVFSLVTAPEPPMDLPYIEGIWFSVSVSDMILLGFCLGLTCISIVLRLSGLCCKCFFLCIRSWTTTVPFLLPPLKVCTSLVPDVLNRSLWGRSPTLRHLYSHLPTRTASCQMSWQPCQSEGRVVALG